MLYQGQFAWLIDFIQNSKEYDSIYRLLCAIFPINGKVEAIFWSERRRFFSRCDDITLSQSVIYTWFIVIDWEERNLHTSTTFQLINNNINSPSLFLSRYWPKYYLQSKGCPVRELGKEKGKKETISEHNRVNF